jgi:hypothetical protein
MALSPEEIQAITQAVAEALKPTIVEEANKAAGAHVTNRNKSFEEKLNSRIDSLAKATPVEEDQPEKVTLTTRMNKLEEENRRLISQNKAEKEANARANMRSIAESALLKGKVDQKLLKAAVAQLMHEDKLIDLDETGNAYFKSNSNGYEDKLPLEEGINGWLKTNGQAFIASPKANGTGIRDVRTTNSAQSQDALTEEEYKAAVVQMIRDLR